MRERVPAYDIVEGPDEEPLVLVGQPGALSGELRLRNPGEERVVLRQGALRGRLTGVGEEPSVVQRLPSVVLRPGQSRRVPLALSLPGTTPPGEYRAEIDLGGRTREVVLHVTEVVDLEVSPPEVVLENRPGEVIEKRIVCTNAGNVDLELGDIGAVVLDDELLECRTLRAALDEWVEREGETTDERATLRFFADVLRQARRTLARAGFLRVRTRGGEVTLRPGETRALDLEIRVPDNLERHSRYVGTAALYTTDLVFHVVPRRGAPAPEPPDPTTERAPQPGGKPAQPEQPAKRRPAARPRKATPP